MNNKKAQKPPRAFQEFTRRFPKIGEAWERLGEAGRDGPLDDKTARLIKLGVHMACRSEGGTHSAVRKALDAGAQPEELYQVLALTASAIGLPSVVAAFTWVEEELEKRKG